MGHLSTGRVRVLIFALICVVISLPASAQLRRDWKQRIDFLVEKADSLSMHTQTMFYSERMIRKDQWVRETWHYTEENDRVIVFQVRYLLNDREITEAYYMDRNQLICVERIVAPNAAIYIDEIQSGELFFLENNALRQYVCYGNKKVTRSYGQAQENCITDFQNRYEELRRNIQIVKATRKS